MRVKIKIPEFWDSSSPSPPVATKSASVITQQDGVAATANKPGEKTRLSDVLKSKHEETEAYLSEIETIGQAYDDM